jgi:hypothetical protein
LKTGREDHKQYCFKENDLHGNEPSRLENQVLFSDKGESSQENILRKEKNILDRLEFLEEKNSDSFGFLSETGLCLD